MSHQWSRQEDERALRVLRMHVLGDMTASEIAAEMGTTKGRISGTMDRVRREDMSACGDGMASYYKRGAFQ